MIGVHRLTLIILRQIKINHACYMKLANSPSHSCHQHPVFGPLFSVQVIPIHPYHHLLWICSQALPFPNPGLVVLLQCTPMWGHITHNCHCPLFSPLDWEPHEAKIVSGKDPTRIAQFLAHTFNELCVYMNIWMRIPALESALKTFLKRYPTHYIQMGLTMKRCLNGCLPPKLCLTRVRVP